MTAPTADVDFSGIADWSPLCQLQAGDSDSEIYWECDNEAEYYAEVHCAPCWRPKLICKDCLYAVAAFQQNCHRHGVLAKSSDRIRNVKLL